ncbi:MAG: hypothetical protein QM767_15920 [Anaeromyxobacter sp.]
MTPYHTSGFTSFSWNLVLLLIDAVHEGMEVQDEIRLRDLAPLVVDDTDGKVLEVLNLLRLQDPQHPLAHDEHAVLIRQEVLQGDPVREVLAHRSNVASDGKWSATGIPIRNSNVSSNPLTDLKRAVLASKVVEDLHEGHGGSGR